jgi:hypothetical protein
LGSEPEAGRGRDGVSCMPPREPVAMHWNGDLDRNGNVEERVPL